MSKVKTKQITEDNQATGPQDVRLTLEGKQRKRTEGVCISFMLHQALLACMHLSYI